jgi:tripartite-type tricarboxylate transporter receptor subunit TctC
MISRRELTKALALMSLPAPGLLQAQAKFPSQPVKLVIPYPAGGATDVIGRSLAERLTATWGQQVIVDNRPGAGTTLAAAQIARAPGDGYTLYMTTSAHTISGSLYKKLDFDPVRNFAALSLLAKVPLVLVVSPSVPAKTLTELIAYARSRPKGLTFASPGNGTAQHLTGELFKVATKLELTHVPYRGDAPAVTDLMGGQVDMMFATLTAVIPQINANQLHAIALANGKRIPIIAAVPTFAEAGMPGFEAATWFGTLAPASMPTSLREKIATDLQKIGDEPDLQKRIAELGGEMVNDTPAQFEAFMKSEADKWREAVRVSGATID